MSCPLRWALAGEQGFCQRRSITLEVKTPRHPASFDLSEPLNSASELHDSAERSMDLYRVGAVRCSVRPNAEHLAVRNEDIFRSEDDHWTFGFCVRVNHRRTVPYVSVPAYFERLP
jgi:hypothetical protein